MGLFNGGIFKGINKALTKAWDINVQGTKLVGAALFPGAGNYMAQQEANKANKQLQDQANQQNLALWNAQNLYNTPAEQVKRLEAAGLNPQLAYGQLADSKAGAAPEMEAVHYEAPKYSGPSLMETLSSYQQIVNMQESNKKIRLDNALAAEALRYNKYENDQYMKTGSLKGDAPHVKEAGAVLRAFGNMFNWLKSIGTNDTYQGRVPMHLVPVPELKFKAGSKF